ncbi:peptidoglycan bridge formation glycyltransferase FemA/FemB family protein [Candidatus Parcubacteria bacterium]|nr:peptidoglycan bridge formation glycyltransferase FemA/FemB family protein [Candidatus Parcubacteria bacterium]
MWKNLTGELSPGTWNAFVTQHAPASGAFLQSWQWGEMAGGQRWGFLSSQTSERVEGSSGISGVASVMERTIPGIGRYAYCPRGPILSDELLKAFSLRGKQAPHGANLSTGCAVGELASAIEGIIFFRFEPPQRSFGPLCGPQDDRMCVPTFPIQPAMTRLTDLSASEADLLGAMHPKLRYNIRLAQKNGVRIRFDMQELSRVWHLFEETSARGEFRLHDQSYYERLLTKLTGECRAFLATAWFEDHPVVANLLIDFAGVRTYLHGASSHEHRALMAPHLLHWELLRDGKAHGLQTYDWWGVSPLERPDHPWAGVSRFKRSFPGWDLEYPGTYDLVKRPGWYRVYALARRLRRAM